MRPSPALLVTSGLLAASFVVVYLEANGAVVLPSVTNDLRIGVGSVTVAGAVLGVVAARQRWRLGPDDAAAHSGLLLVILAAFIVGPRLVIADHRATVAAMVIAGQVTALLSAIEHHRRSGRSAGVASVGSAVRGAATLAGSVVLSVLLSRIDLASNDWAWWLAVSFGVLAISWFILAVELLRAGQAQSADSPGTWTILLYLSLGTAAAANSPMIAVNPPGARPDLWSVSVTLLIGVGALLYINLVEVTRALLVEREAAETAQSETTLAVARLVEQTRHHHARVHDTRNAIAAIAGGLDALARFDEERLENPGWLVGEIRSEVTRLQGIIESPHRSSSIEVFSVGEVIGPMIVCYQIAGRRIVYDNSVDAAALGRAGDTAEVVQNLLENALRYARASEIRVTIELAHDSIVIVVSDDGVGIPDSERAAIFDDGFRGTTARGSGSGLGLWLARSLTMAQGGRIECDSSPSGGAEFRVFLRAATTSARASGAGPVIDLREPGPVPANEWA